MRWRKTRKKVSWKVRERKHAHDQRNHSIFRGVRSFTLVLSACVSTIKDNNTPSAYNLKMCNRYMRAKCMAQKKERNKERKTKSHFSIWHLTIFPFFCISMMRFFLFFLLLLLSLLSLHFFFWYCSCDALLCFCFYLWLMAVSMWSFMHEHTLIILYSFQYHKFA